MYSMSAILISLSISNHCKLYFYVLFFLYQMLSKFHSRDYFQWRKNLLYKSVCKSLSNACFFGFKKWFSVFLLTFSFVLFQGGRQEKKIENALKLSKTFYLHSVIILLQCNKSFQCRSIDV